MYTKNGKSLILKHWEPAVVNETIDFQQNVIYILLKINVKLNIEKLDLEYALGSRIITKLRETPKTNRKEGHNNDVLQSKKSSAAET